MTHPASYLLGAWQGGAYVVHAPQQGLLFCCRAFREQQFGSIALDWPPHASGIQVRAGVQPLVTPRCCSSSCLFLHVQWLGRLGQTAKCQVPAPMYLLLSFPILSGIQVFMMLECIRTGIYMLYSFLHIRLSYAWLGSYTQLISLSSSVAPPLAHTYLSNLEHITVQ